MYKYGNTASLHLGRGRAGGSSGGSGTSNGGLGFQCHHFLKIWRIPQFLNNPRSDTMVNGLIYVMES